MKYFKFICIYFSNENFSRYVKFTCLIFLAESLVIFPKAKFTIYKFKWAKSFMA